MSASFQKRGLKGIIKIPVVLFYLESDIPKVVCQLKLYVSRMRAAGCGPVIPVITFVLTGDIHRSVYALGRYGNLVRDGYRILFILGVGTHKPH